MILPGRTGPPGSWSYTARGGGTDWTQTATLQIRTRFVGWLMAPLLRRNMHTLMRKAMVEAKRIMEAQPAAGAATGPSG